MTLYEALFLASNTPKGGYWFNGEKQDRATEAAVILAEEILRLNK